MGQLRELVANPPRWLARTVRVLTGIELTIGVGALLVILFLVLVQAVQRYLPFAGWSWTGELARFCLVWLTFVVAGVLVSRDQHIAIEAIDSVRNPLVVRSVRVFSCLVVAAIGVGLSVEAWTLVGEQAILRSPAMGLPMAWFYAISLIGFVSMTLRALVAAVRFVVLGVPPADRDEVPVT